MFEQRLKSHSLGVMSEELHRVMKAGQDDHEEVSDL